MYHNMFYTGKALLYGVMHMFRNLVRITKRGIAICADLDIHIDTVAKNPCAQKVHPQHALLFQRAVFQTVLQVLITCLVNHLVYGILKNIIRRLLYKKANTQAGNCVANRPSGDAMHLPSVHLN